MDGGVGEAGSGDPIQLALLACLLEKQTKPLGNGGIERTNWILRTELEFQTEDFVHVQWVCVEDFDVELPFLEAFCRHQLDSWR